VKDRKGFTFFREYRDLLKDLKPVDKFIMYEAIASYFLDGVVVDVGELSDIFSKIREYVPPKTRKNRRKRKGRTKRAQKYNAYLRSEHWRNFRGHILTLRRRCEVCGSTEKLQVHHKWYGTRKNSILYREKDDEVAVLCQKCHEKYHKGYKRATKEGYKRFYNENKRTPIVRVLKKDGGVIDMAKAVEEIKRKNSK
jgi:hypothetical protein